MFVMGGSLNMTLDGRHGVYRIVGLEHQKDRVLIRVTHEDGFMLTLVSDYNDVVSQHSSESVALAAEDALDALLSFERKLDVWSPELRKIIHDLAVTMIGVTKEEPWLNRSKGEEGW